MKPFDSRTILYDLREELYLQIWVEDSGSGYIFWNHINKTLFNNRFKVIGEKGNRGIRNKIRNNTSTEVIIVIVDRMIDNEHTKETYKSIIEESKKQTNINIVLYGSLERAFLTYNHLTSFIPDYPQMEHLRDIIIENSSFCGTIKLNQITDESFWHFCHFNVSPDNHGNQFSETIYSALLANLTHNTKANITKNKLGPCWIIDCCSKDNRRTCKIKKRSIDKETKLLDILQYSEFGFTCNEIYKSLGQFLNITYNGNPYDKQWKEPILKNISEIDVAYFADKYMIETGINSWNYEKIYRRFHQ